MNLLSCGETHTCKRTNNEDAFGIKEISPYLAVFVVADGLGGHPAGEVASRLAVEAIIQTVQVRATTGASWSRAQLREILREGFAKASHDIADHLSFNPDHAGMATTLVAALINDSLECVVANVGDSRAYLSGNTISQITKDHSFIQDLFDRGLVTREAMRLHPEKNIVTRIVNEEPVSPDLFDCRIEGGTLLLCSDGLTDALTDDQIFSFVKCSDFNKICGNLIEGAKKIGRDNITVIAIRPGGVP